MDAAQLFSRLANREMTRQYYTARHRYYQRRVLLLVRQQPDLKGSEIEDQAQRDCQVRFGISPDDAMQRGLWQPQA